jgi:uncharacterized repeat protein (TIGR02543 family)
VCGGGGGLYGALPMKHGIILRAVSAAGALAAAAILLLPASAPAGTAGTPVTLTFTTIGEHSFTVPANVSQLHVVAVGGKGAAGGTGPDGTIGGQGGNGARVTADVSVTPGATLYAEVGGNAVGSEGGGPHGGPATGGDGGFNGAGDAGGGGAASLLTPCSTSGVGCVACPPFIGNTCTPALAALVVAGGGGGGGGPAHPGSSGTGGCGCSRDDASGGDAGDEGADGQNGAVSATSNGNLSAAQGGKAGAQTATTNGGAGGSMVCSSGAAAGGNGQSGFELGGGGGLGGSDEPGAYTLGEAGGVGGGGGGGRFGGGGGGAGGFEACTLYSGWGGGAGGGGGSSFVSGATAAQLAADTTVDTSATPSVTVSYTIPPQQTLTVVTAGGGSGTVTSSPSGIDCGSTCSAQFDAGSQVTLTAAAGSGSVFAGWSGGCTGTGPCTVTMNADQTVTATFKLATHLAATPVLRGRLTATLTRSDTGAPLAGQTITFSVRGQTQCVSVTNAQGKATCGGLRPFLAAIRARGYEAVFAGTTTYEQSTATAGLL